MNNLPNKQRSELLNDDTRKNNFIVKLQNFCTQYLNKEVNKNALKKHPIAKDSYYLPISFMEAQLDEIFFGQWEVKNFKWEKILNEIVCSLELSVFNPQSERWITRVGVSAKKIMVDGFPEKYPHSANEKTLLEWKRRRNEWNLDLQNKKPEALEMGGFAALKAEAFKNACISLGKYFGRDVNREYVDTVDDWVPDRTTQLETIRKELSKTLDLCQDDELRESIIKETLDAEENKTNSVNFYQDQIKRITNL